ncbi:MAG: esterase family protein [Acidobacteria bacterium]|nr:esterase family protein [Acidobacteriota bacterium]
MRVLAFALFGVLVPLVPAAGQEAFVPKPNTYRSMGAGGGAPRLISPETGADRRITFRIRAPKAGQVELLFGAWNPKPQAMAKDAGGTWSLTIGPVEPQIYTYVFLVDGARVLDGANPALKTGARGLDASVVEVMGTPARFDQVRAVPHGSIHVLQYMSTPLKKLRGLYVYVPPQYEVEPKRKFPVLYLRHGSGDTESNWSADGRAGVILENLLAEGKAVPMLVVMTNGDTDNSWAGGSSPQAMEALGQELLGDVIPLIEKRYRVLAGREHRAIAGLSMGGGQAFTIGLRNPGSFAWVAEFSSGLLSDANFDLKSHIPGMLEDARGVNARLRLLYVSCGEADPRIPGHENLSGLLKSKGIRHEYKTVPGGHEWVVWRMLLADLLPRLFR